MKDKRRKSSITQGNKTKKWTLLGGEGKESLNRGQRQWSTGKV